MNRSAITAFFMMIAMVAMSQTTVVADKVTRQPISRASLYAKTNGQFNSVTTDPLGRATVSFPFRKLTVSHLNYEKQTLASVPDTIWLTPLYRSTGEVVIRNVEPEWIRRKLKQFVKEKRAHYLSQPLMLDYEYHTQSIDGRHFYRYDSEGYLRLPESDQKRYALCQRKGVITSVDSTRLTDMANLRRLLYEDVVYEMDKNFISSHRFYVNGDYETDNKHVVELLFRGKKRRDDRGAIVIDTSRCVILSTRRVAALETNRSLRTSAFMVALARFNDGYKILSWDTDIRTDYAELNGCFYPANTRFKFYFMNTETSEKKKDEKDDFDQQTGGGFANMESTMLLKPVRGMVDAAEWKTVPQPWYLKFFSDEERQYEVELSNLPAEFRLADDF